MTAPGYWRAAFNARPLGMPIPPNWFALAAFGLLGFFLSPGFWLLGAGLEIGYLGWLSSQPRFRQSVDAQAQQAAAGADPAEVRYLGLHQQLAAEDRQRQQQIEARAREIVVSLDQSPLLASHADSLEQLVWLHLRLLAARQAMLRVVATAHRESDQLSAQEQHIARRLGADNIDSELRRSLEQQQAVIDQRQAAHADAGRRLEHVDAELARIDQQIALIREQALLATDEGGIGQSLDALTASFNEANRWLDGQRDLLGVFENTAAHPLPARVLRAAGATKDLAQGESA